MWREPWGQVIQPLIITNPNTSIYIIHYFQKLQKRKPCSPKYNITNT